jgi:hypothetical protein
MCFSEGITMTIPAISILYSKHATDVALLIKKKIQKTLY